MKPNWVRKFSVLAQNFHFEEQQKLYFIWKKSFCLFIHEDISEEEELKWT
jgi:hypothetical protein